MHLSILAARRLRLSNLVQLHLTWSRSIVQVQKSENRIPQDVEGKNPTNNEESQKSDPFGLDYMGMDTLVQGLYTKPEDEVPIVEFKSRAETAKEAETTFNKLTVEDKYKSWFGEKKPNVIGEDSELVRTTGFGTIRFDSDNAMRVEMGTNDDLDREEYEMASKMVKPLPLRKPSENDVRTRTTIPETRNVIKEKYEPEPEPSVVQKSFAPKTYERQDNSRTARPTSPEAGNDLIRADSRVPIDRQVTSTTDTPKIHRTRDKGRNESDVSAARTKVEMGTSHDFDVDESRTIINPRIKLSPMASKLRASSEPTSLLGKSTTLTADPERDVPVVAPPLRNFKEEPTEESEDSPVQGSFMPKVYVMQDYNRITRDDIWNILKHNIVFQNDYLLAINKPYGIPMHTPGKECRYTINDFAEELAKVANCEKVFPLHRLDKETTGVLLLAKNQQAADIIKEKFKQRQIAKLYLALTKNRPRMPHGTIRIPISEGQVGGSTKFRSVLKPDLREYKINSKQQSAREAITHFKVLKSSPDSAFLEIRIETGVKHQIRVHLAVAVGCPILGDHKYSHADKFAPQRLGSGVLNRLKISQGKVRHIPIHLHCSQVKFTMPDGFSPGNEPVFITARPPTYFMYSMSRLGFHN